MHIQIEKKNYVHGKNRVLGPCVWGQKLFLVVFIIFYQKLLCGYSVCVTIRRQRVRFLFSLSTTLPPLTHHQT